VLVASLDQGLVGVDALCTKREKKYDASVVKLKIMNVVGKYYSLYSKYKLFYTEN
jgi:hypothetical protein